VPEKYILAAFPKWKRPKNIIIAEERERRR
jgi:hypothetical protein